MAENSLEGWEVRFNELYDLVKDPEHGISVKVNKMYHAIFGVNGSDGLLRKISKLENAVEVMDDAFGRWCDVQKDDEIKNLKLDKDEDKRRRHEKFKDRIMVISLTVAIISTGAAIISRFL